MKRLLLFAVCLLLCCPATGATYRVVDTIDVDMVPSWFPVGFCLLTHGQTQYVGYYNDKHEMIIARRGLDERTWQKATLPSKVGWDSHNYVTMAVDSTGYLHVSGNMHCVPLIYFRSQEPGDITTFERLSMTGYEEHRVTYPKFLEDADGKLLFNYRSGGSGNGKRLYNIYDAETRRWARFHDSPLLDGEGACNAYPQGPVRGPDGRFHIVWVWRDTPDCATNHDLSYARSRDLKHWEAADGTAATLPMTLGQKALCVDPVQSGGGIVNSGVRFLFDSSGRPMIAYHKSDAAGHMQIYIARFEQGRWQTCPITTWKESIQFGGRGAMPFLGIRIGSVRKVEPGLLTIDYRHRDHGSGRIVVDEATLRPVDREVTLPTELPKEVTRATIRFKQIGVKTAGDSGRTAEPNTRYILRWETLPANHDRPRETALPPASALKLIKLQRTTSGKHGE